MCPPPLGETDRIFDVTELADSSEVLEAAKAYTIA